MTTLWVRVFFTFSKGCNRPAFERAKEFCRVFPLRPYLNFQYIVNMWTLSTNRQGRARAGNAHTGHYFCGNGKRLADARGGRALSCFQSDAINKLYPMYIAQYWCCRVFSLDAKYKVDRVLPHCCCRYTSYNRYVLDVDDASNRFLESLRLA